MNETTYPVFRRTNLIRESTFEWNGTEYRLSIYRLGDDGDFFGAVAFADSEGMIGISRTAAADTTEVTGGDPVAALVDHFVAEIQTGDFP